MTLIFVFFVATLNLAVGYVLGATIRWLPARFATRAVAHPLSAAPTPVAAPVAATVQKVSAPVSLAKVALHEPEPIREQANVDTSSQQNKIQSGLASFRDRLASMQSRIEESKGDTKKLNDCASQLSDEGKKFVDESTKQVSGLEADTSVSKALARTKEQIESATERLQAVAQAETAEDKIEILKESTGQIEATTARLAAEMKEVAQPKPIRAEDEQQSEPPSNGLATIEQLQSLIAKHFSSGDSAEPIPIAAIRIDDNADKSRPAFDRILVGISELVAACLDDQQLVAIDESGQLLMMLTGDGTIEATDRLETIRQKVAAAQFEGDGRVFDATVSCGFTDSESFDNPVSLLAGLADTMQEAARFGTNRTFHHDGRLAAPVVPTVIEAEVVTINV